MLGGRGPHRLGSLQEQVVFQVPGGEGQGPEQEATPTQTAPSGQGEGINPIGVILLGVVMFIGGLYGLRKILD